ncbi:MAG: iron ABC transporter permease, partial [Marmoricola sp.]
MTAGRLAHRVGIAVAAAVPLLVLVTFFAYPVAGMVGRGFVVDGRFAPGGVLEVLTRPRTGRVLWFTVWSAGLAT